MWANTVWGFFGLAASFFLGRIAMIHQKFPIWVKRFLEIGAGCLFIAGIVAFFWPHNDSDAPLTSVGGSQSIGQQNAKNITNNFVSQPKGVSADPFSDKNECPPKNIVIKNVEVVNAAQDGFHIASTANVSLCNSRATGSGRDNVHIGGSDETP